MADDIVCNELVELVTEYLEGAMATEDRARLDAHIAVCEGCTNYLAQITTTIRLTGTLPPERVPDPVRARLVEAFHSWRRGDPVV